MSYVVKVSIRPLNSYDDILDAEYSGVEHKSIQAAEMELQEAWADPSVWDVWIDEK